MKSFCSQSRLVDGDMVDTCIGVFGMSWLIPSKVARVLLKAQCAVA